MSKPTKYYCEVPNHQLVIHAVSLIDAICKWGKHFTTKQIALPLNMVSLRVHYGRRDAGVDVPLSRALIVMPPMVWQLLQLDMCEVHGDQALAEFCQRVNCEFNLGKLE